ncbi:MAG: thiopurine S-methyltransferase [Gammaproteobacteria bacterium]
MDAGFWHRKWETNEIGFHVGEANPHLVGYFSALTLEKGDRVFLPLCGKTLDIAWLLASGYRVVGAELSGIAIEQLFAGLGVEPEISDAGEWSRYSAEGIDIFVGDIFRLTARALGPVDAVYDRAALVALPGEIRGRYAAHLAEITAGAPQLLICYEYDQALAAGPPFSVSSEEVGRHYRGGYDLSLLASVDVPGGLKGKCAARENIWLLKGRVSG